MSGPTRALAPMERRRFADRVWPALIMIISLAVLATAPQAYALEVEEITSPLGVPVWFVEEHTVPLVSIHYAFVGGAVQDRPGQEGATKMLTSVLMQGAGALDSKSFKQAAARLGAKLSLSSNRDTIFGGLEALSKHFEASAELLRLALTEPRFDDDAVERIRSQQLIEIALTASDAKEAALERWYAEAFAGHPYGRSDIGTEESVKRLSRAGLKLHYDRLVARDVLRVVVVGDIDRGSVAMLVDHVFGGLAARASLVPIARTRPRLLPNPILVKRSESQATVAFGLPALPVDDPDFPASQVLNHILGSGDFDSRLMNELRVKRGLIYSTRTTLNRDSITAFLLGGFSTKSQTMTAALGVVRDVLTDLARNGPSQSEFENAKRYLTGSFLLDLDSNGHIADSLLGAWLDELRPDYLRTRNERIENVTIVDVNRVAGKILLPDQLSVVIVGAPEL